MSMNDTTADLLTRIRNAQRAFKETVNVPFSKSKLSICNVLKDEGYISSVNVEGETKKIIAIALKYYEGKPVIEQIERVSRPGLRIYKSSKKIPLVKNGLGICIISTSKGIMTDKTAREQNCGGEIICYVS
ncbi:MAG: 30S ribosomal protein S8 [Gammaproteobacteria bacterium]|nr:30S ribosomal protein S8 [Gammaproteobacteria bacterium]